MTPIAPGTICACAEVRPAHCYVHDLDWPHITVLPGTICAYWACNTVHPGISHDDYTQRHEQARARLSLHLSIPPAALDSYHAAREEDR